MYSPFFQRLLRRRSTTTTTITTITTTIQPQRRHDDLISAITTSLVSIHELLNAADQLHQDVRDNTHPGEPELMRHQRGVLGVLDKCARDLRVQVRWWEGEHGRLCELAEKFEVEEGQQLAGLEELVVQLHGLSARVDERLREMRRLIPGGSSMDRFIALARRSL